jgi:hypothetical protein
VQRRGWHGLCSGAGTATAGAEELGGVGGAEGGRRAGGGDGGGGGAGGEADEELRAAAAATPVQVLLAAHEGGTGGVRLVSSLSLSLSLLFFLLILSGIKFKRSEGVKRVCFAAMPLLGCAGLLDVVTGRGRE